MDSIPNSALFCWSGGKDSAMALHEVLRSGKLRIDTLLTTVTKDYGRISMHGVRESLLEAQAESIGLPLRKVFISKEAKNEEYEARMAEALQEFHSRGLRKVVFGDIFLEDLRVYREKNLAAVGMEGVFPLWKRDTRTLAESFIHAGFKAVLVCVDMRKLDPSFTGRPFDKSLLRDLPTDVDPCGENGEFHSYVYAGPIFRKPIGIRTGKRVVRGSHFCFCDLLLSSKETLSC